MHIGIATNLYIGIANNQTGIASTKDTKNSVTCYTIAIIINSNRSIVSTAIALCLLPIRTILWLKCMICSFCKLHICGSTFTLLFTHSYVNLCFRY